MTNLERKILKEIRSIQRTVDPLFCLSARKSRDVQALMDSVPAVAVRDYPVSTTEVLLPFRRGDEMVGRFGIAPNLPFAVERYETFRRFVQFRAAPTGGPGGRIVPHVVALCALLNVGDVQEKGAAFVRRKLKALEDYPEIYGGFSPRYIISLATGVLCHLREHPRASGAADCSRSGRYHLDVGRTARRHQRYRSASAHLRRAIEVGKAAGDWRTVSLALLNVGLLRKHRGDYQAAEKWMRKAAACARSHRLRTPYAMALHDLAGVFIEQRNTWEGTRYARRAFRAYRNGTAQKLRLAFDVAYMWMEQNHHARALTVFTHLLPNMQQSRSAPLLQAAMVRASACGGDSKAYEAIWPTAWAAVFGMPAHEERSRALLELAIGFCGACDYQKAERCADEAHTVARLAGETGVCAEADEWRNVIRLRSSVLWTVPPCDHVGDKFVAEIVKAITTAQPRA